MRTSRIPLFIGIAVFIIAILVSAVKIGQNRSLTSENVKANVSGAELSLQYIAPETVSVILNTAKTVSGVDVWITLSPRDLEVLPSTLQAGSGYITSGGTYDQTNQSFVFSAIRAGEAQSQIVATFQLGPKARIASIDGVMDFNKTDGNTSVIEKDSGADILVKTTGVKFKLPKT